MKQGMKEFYEKGVANHSASSFAVCTVRCTAKRNRGTGGLGIELRKDAIRTLTLLHWRKAIRAGAISEVPARSCVVVDLRHAWKLHAREPGDLGDACFPMGSRTAGEGSGRTARMDVAEESDRGTVPMNHSNKVEQSMAESEEGRSLIEENTHQTNTRTRDHSRKGSCH